MESSQLYAAMLTHYSTEPLTTGPDYDPLLLLLALAGDVHPNPGPSRYPYILQWNANGIGNKQTELSIFLEAHNVKMAAIQEFKLTAKSRSPNIKNYTLVRQGRRQGPEGGLLGFFIHNSVSFTRKPMSTTSKNDPHLKELTISIAMDNTELLITNVYFPPASSCNGRYSPPIDHLLTGTDSLVLGDFNAHHSLCHSRTTDTRGNQLSDSVSISSFSVLSTDSPTRLPGNAAPVLQMYH